MSPNHQVSKTVALYKHLIEMIFFAQKSDIVLFSQDNLMRISSIFDLKIVNKILPQRHGLSFAGEETRTMV